MLGEHWPARRGEAAVAGGGWLRLRLRDLEGAAALKQVRPQRVQVIAGPRTLAKDSSVEILDRENIVMIARGEGERCRQDKLTPSLDSGLLCSVTTQVREGGWRCKRCQTNLERQNIANPTPLKSRSLMWRVVVSFCAVRGFSAVIFFSKFLTEI